MLKNSPLLSGPWGLACSTWGHQILPRPLVWRTVELRKKIKNLLSKHCGTVISIAKQSETEIVLLSSQVTALLKWVFRTSLLLVSAGLFARRGAALVAAVCVAVDTLPWCLVDFLHVNRGHLDNKKQIKSKNVTSFPVSCVFACWW